MLAVLVVLLMMRASCHAPGYDLRRTVRPPWRHERHKPVAFQPQPGAGDVPPSSPTASPAPVDDDAIDEAHDVGTWPPDAVSSVSPPACPPEMVLVEGNYCPVSQQTCLQWIDEGSTFLPNHRCARFAEPSRCLSKERVFMRFCIDRDEHGDPSSGLPDADVSWTMAAQVCQSEEKRLCAEAEWVFACEGPDMLPYPTGFTRDATVCNYDRTDLMDGHGGLKDLRKRAGDLPRCTSPFGVRNMVGNVDEWVVREGVTFPPFRSALKGGWWMAARNRCRPATTAHDEHYRDKQTGFRCCRDALP